MKLNKISTLISFQYHCKIIRNKLEIILEAISELHINKYFEKTNLKLEGGSLVTNVTSYSQVFDAWIRPEAS